MVGTVTRAVAADRLADIVLLHGERFRSYMAAPVSVSGAPMAVLTMVTTRVGCTFGAGDLAFLALVADWTGLGLENALRRELQPRASVGPPPVLELSSLSEMRSQMPGEMEVHRRARARR